jgi:glycosyltransferase involved in cell wall biosynthesis
MPTIHLIYPHGPAISCPQAIGRNLAQALASLGTVVCHDIDGDADLHPQPGDILIGHPGSCPWHLFNRSVRKPGWARRIGIQPYCPGDPRLQAYSDHVLPHCDRFLAICGDFWFRRTPHTLFRHWGPKLVHLDLAVDRRDFPLLKSAFNPPGRRRFLYIGHSAWYKNPAYLCTLARAHPEHAIAWAGRMRGRYRGPERLGSLDFSTAAGRELVRGFDFMLTVGSADANPTTILEAMAWGLVPVCTRESGYADQDGIVNLPIDDLPGAAAVLSRLQHAPEDELQRLQQVNLRRLDEHFNWPRLCAQVIAVVRGEDSPALLPRSRTERLRMRLWEHRSPHSWLRPRPLRHRLLALAGLRRRRS